MCTAAVYKTKDFPEDADKFIAAAEKENLETH